MCLILTNEVFDGAQAERLVTNGSAKNSGCMDLNTVYGFDCIIKRVPKL